MLVSPMLIMGLGALERSGFREHVHLLSLGGLGIIAATTIALVDNHYLSRLYRSYAYVQRQNRERDERTARRIDYAYVKVNLESLIRNL